MTPHETELRDRFAEGALHAMITEPLQPGQLGTVGQVRAGPSGEPAAKQYAIAAYILADAMLEARKVQP